MPFDYAEYQAKCNTLSTEQLQKEWENYTRQIAGGATSTATSVLFSPLTAGISLVGLGLSAPRIHNARKKREIIEKGLQQRGTTHSTRTRDVAGSMAVSGTIAVATLGLAGPLADAAAGEAVGKGVEYAIAHVALDGVGAGIEHLHDGHLKKKGEQELKMKAMQAQLANLQMQGNPVMVQAPGQTMQQQYYEGQQMQFQQPALTAGMALPQPGILMQNQQQIQWQQQQGGLQIPGMQQPDMQIPGQPGFVPPLRPHSAAPENQYSQYNVVGQVQVQVQEQYTQQLLPQYPGVQQQDGKYHLNVVQNEQQQQQQMYPNEKSAAFTTQDNVVPLPLYSQQTNEHERAAPPDHIDLPAAPSMEEEIAFLKARLLQMEMEKRGMSATISGPLEISLDGGPNAKKEVEQPKVNVQEVTPPAQQETRQNFTAEAPKKDFLSSMERVAPMSAPAAPTDRVASPEIHIPKPMSAPALGQQPSEPQYAQAQPVQSPLVEQQYAPQQPAQAIQNQQQQYAPQQPTHQIQNQQQQYAPQQPAQLVQDQQQQYAIQQPIQQVQNPQRQGSVSQQQQSQFSPGVAPTQQTQPHYAPQQTTQQVQTVVSQPFQNQNQPLSTTPQQYQTQVPVQQVQTSYPQQQQTVYAQPQPKPNHPPVQRQDSGYYSQAPTPLSRPVSSISSISSMSPPLKSRHQSISSISSVSSSIYSTQPQINQPRYTPQPQFQQPQYNPQQQQQQRPIYQPQPQQQPQYNPQQNVYNPAQHGRSQSVVSQAPPPYFAPPPTAPQPVLAGKDYFGSAVNQQPQAHPSFPQYGTLNGGQQFQQQQQWQQHQQWAQPPIQQQQQVAAGGEPNYGPAPPIPGVWRG